ncbi:MAG TPA: LysR substrate-binding domain-containing protein [Pseudolabrys sp.]|nr:LysR substrate-binding domain-containing protein [Pseudolabrys sp.]
MELRHLRYFAAVATELHFARAAERLNITPPTLSQQIKWLESHLGVTLFVRSTRKRVELTVAGKQFQKHALALIANFEQAERFVREAARGEVGEVRLGYVVSAATAGDVKTAIVAAQAAAPNVKVHIQRMETLPQIKALSSGGLDIGFMRRMYTLPAGLVSFELPAQRLRLFIHRDHPLAAQKRISPAAMAKYKFVAYELDAEVGFWRNITAVLAPAAIPEIAQRAPDAVSLLTLISANIGMSVLPESFKSIVPPEVVMRDITGPVKYTQNAVVYRANEASPAVRAVVKSIRSAMASA